MEVLTDFKNLRLSALVAAILTVSTAMTVSKPAKGENIEPSLPLPGTVRQDSQPGFADIKVADLQRCLASFFFFQIGLGDGCLTLRLSGGFLQLFRLDRVPRVSQRSGHLRDTLKPA